MAHETDLARRVGQYRKGERTLTVRLGDAGLVLDALLWPRNRLLPAGPNVLEAQSWPLLLTFIENDGEVLSMRIDGPQVGQFHWAGIYKKLRPDRPAT